MCKVKKNHKYGFVNEQSEVIPCQFDIVSDFENGLAKVCKNDIWYKIDKSGNVSNTKKIIINMIIEKLTKAKDNLIVFAYDLNDGMIKRVKSYSITKNNDKNKMKRLFKI